MPLIARVAHVGWEPESATWSAAGIVMGFGGELIWKAWRPGDVEPWEVTVPMGQTGLLTGDPNLEAFLLDDWFGLEAAILQALRSHRAPASSRT